MCRSGSPEVDLTSPRISSNTVTTESPSTRPVSALHVTCFCSKSFSLVSVQPPSFHGGIILERKRRRSEWSASVLCCLFILERKQFNLEIGLQPILEWRRFHFLLSLSLQCNCSIMEMWYCQWLRLCEFPTPDGDVSWGCCYRQTITWHLSQALCIRHS